MFNQDVMKKGFAPLYKQATEAKMHDNMTSLLAEL